MRVCGRASTRSWVLTDCLVDEYLSVSAPLSFGTKVAEQGGVKTKLTLPIAIVLGVLAPFALPAGAAEAVAGAVAMMADLHIMEFAVSANALTTVF